MSSDLQPESSCTAEQVWHRWASTYWASPIKRALSAHQMMLWAKKIHATLVPARPSHQGQRSFLMTRRSTMSQPPTWCPALKSDGAVRHPARVKIRNPRAFCKKLIIMEMFPSVSVSLVEDLLRESMSLDQ